MKTIIMLTLILAAFICPSIGFAANVTLAWDEVTDGDVVLYRIFARESGESYNYSYPEKEVEESQVTLNGFDEYETYYFVVRAVDSEGNESGDSNEAYWDPIDTSEAGASLSTDNDISAESASSGCFISTLIGD